MFLRKILFLAVIILNCVLKVVSQVNLQTGGIDYSIPLYSYQDGANRLSTSLSLGYTASNGLKVNDYSSEFGTGWVLRFGGVIERMQNGEPDDQKQDGVYNYPGILNGSEWIWYRNTYYPNGYLYSEYDPSTPVDNGGGYTPLLENEAKYKKLPIYLADREQDVFAFSFNGRSGTFLIGKNGTIRTTVDSKLKIDKVITNMSSSNIRTRISEFQITDENGIKYTFKDMELSEVIEYEKQTGTIGSSGWIPLPVGTIVPNTFAFYGGTPKNQFIVNKWFLSEILNPLTGAKILFTYDSYAVDFMGEKVGNHSITNVPTSVSNQTTHTGLLQLRKKGVLKRIKTIKLTEKEKVEFIYSTMTRKDISSIKSIEEIQIKLENTIINKWEFEFGYFVGNSIKGVNDVFTEEEMYKSRLCLLKICNAGKNQNCVTPPYQFEYFTGVIPTLIGGIVENLDYKVCPMFSFYQDHWGYSNSPVWTSPNIYLDQPRNDISYSNINWSVVRGFSKNEFAWGGTPNKNWRDPYDHGYVAGTLRIIKFPYGGSLEYEVEPNMALKLGTTQEYRVGGCRVAKTKMYDGIDHANDIINEYKYISSTGNLTSGWGFEEPVYRNDITSEVWKCNFKKPGIDVYQIANAFATSINAINEISYLNSFSFATSGNMMSAATWNAKNGAPDRISGAVQQMVASLLINMLVDAFTPDYKDFPIEQYSTLSNTYSNPLPTSYSRVEIINKLGAGSIGKIVQEFTSDQDPGYAIDVPVVAVPNSKKPRFAGWLYGLPKTAYVYDANGNVLKKTETVYQHFKNTLADNNFISRKWEPIFLTVHCDFIPWVPGSPNCILQESYYPIYGRIHPVTSKEYAYNANGETTLTTTDYEYNSQNYQLSKIKTTNSKGEQIETRTYYPHDYTLTGAVQLLKDNNVFNVPVSTQAVIRKNGTTDYVTGGSITEFALLNGDIKPVKTHSFRSANPVLSSLVPFNPNQLVPGTSYVETGSINYNSGGLPAQINSEAGKASTLYDYDNKLPVASVMNAEVNDVSFTSFEAESSGNWGIGDMNIETTNENFLTGRKCYKFPTTGGTITNNTLNTSKTYKLSFWSKGGLPNIYKGIPPNHNTTGISLTKSYTNISTGWTYYEYTISNTSFFKIDNNQGGLTEFPLVIYLDELRLYPLNSRMTTVTYDPLIGKTSETDDNGRITYYEYDNLGRLKTIKDQYRNVIKAYEYNFKN